MDYKLNYENVSVEIVLLKHDVITASGAFNGDDDMIDKWSW